MFSWIVPGKMVGCWETIEINERRVGVCRRQMSMPPREIAGRLLVDGGDS